MQILVNEVQLEKHPFLSDLIDGGRFISINDLHPLNALHPIRVTNFGKTISEIDEQSSKALSGISVTDSGIFICDKEEQLEKHPSFNVTIDD